MIFYNCNTAKYNVYLYTLTVFEMIIYYIHKAFKFKRLLWSPREIVTNLSEMRAFIARPRIITLFSFRFAVGSFSGRLWKFSPDKHALLVKNKKGENTPKSENGNRIFFFCKSHFIIGEKNGRVLGHLAGGLKIPCHVNYTQLLKFFTVKQIVGVVSFA